MSIPEGPRLFRDPWARREAWRKHPVFQRSAMFRKMFPGFGIGLAAFTTYVIIENTILKPKEEHHH